MYDSGLWDILFLLVNIDNLPPSPVLISAVLVSGGEMKLVHREMALNATVLQSHKGQFMVNTNGWTNEERGGHFPSCMFLGNALNKR